MAARTPDIRHFRAFVEVARQRSFSRAASTLAISQPALTLSIQQFEEILGVALFVRTTRSVSLSQAGEILLPRAEAILQDVEAAVFATRSSQRATQNRIVVAALPSVVIRVLPQAISSFADRMPDATVVTADDNGRGVEAHVLEGRADFGISNAWSEESAFVRTPFLSDLVGLICHSSHPLARLPSPLAWSRLSDLDVVGMAPDTGVHRLMEGRGDLPASVQKPAVTVLTIAALVGLVEGGKTVSALPALAAPDYLNPSLVFRKLSDPVVFRDLELIWSRTRPPSPAARAFMEHLSDSAGRLASKFPGDTVRPPG